jgi:hypothetical protein
VLVLARDTQHAEKVVPTRVWLESFEKRVQDARDALALILDESIKVRSVLREREIVTVVSSELEGRAVDGLVERMSQIVEGIRREHAEAARHFLGEAQLADTLSRLRVTLLDWDCLASADESLESRIEILHVVPCACDE